MSKVVDMVGKKYNMLTVVGRVESSKNGKAMWDCICDCGNHTIVSGSNIRSGTVKSCGCLVLKNRHAKHYQTNTRLYKTWAAMKSRCNNPKNKSYKDYGARGIKVCKEWSEEFLSFYNWAYNNGYSETMTIERRDNERDYSPENCLWIEKGEQSQNRRSCINVQYNGKTQNLMQWCKELNLDYKRINNRIKKLGMSFEEAISKPVETKKRNKKARENYG